MFKGNQGGGFNFRRGNRFKRGESHRDKFSNDTGNTWNNPNRSSANNLKWERPGYSRDQKHNTTEDTRTLHKSVSHHRNHIDDSPNKRWYSSDDSIGTSKNSQQSSLPEVQAQKELPKAKISRISEPRDLNEGDTISLYADSDPELDVDVLEPNKRDEPEKKPFGDIKITVSSQNKNTRDISVKRKLPLGKSASNSVAAVTTMVSAETTVTGSTKKDNIQSTTTLRQDSILDDIEAEFIGKAIMETLEKKTLLKNEVQSKVSKSASEIICRPSPRDFKHDERRNSNAREKQIIPISPPNSQLAVVRRNVNSNKRSERFNSSTSSRNVFLERNRFDKRQKQFPASQGCQKVRQPMSDFGKNFMKRSSYSEFDTNSQPYRPNFEERLHSRFENNQSFLPPFTERSHSQFEDIKPHILQQNEQFNQQYESMLDQGHQIKIQSGNEQDNFNIPWPSGSQGDFDQRVQPQQCRGPVYFNNGSISSPPVRTTPQTVTKVLLPTPASIGNPSSASLLKPEDIRRSNSGIPSSNNSVESLTSPSSVGLHYKPVISYSPPFGQAVTGGFMVEPVGSSIMSPCLPTPESLGVSVISRLDDALESQQFESVLEIARESLSKSQFSGRRFSSLSSHTFTEKDLAQLIDKLGRKFKAFTYIIRAVHLLNNPSDVLLNTLCSLVESYPEQMALYENEIWIIFNKVLGVGQNEAIIDTFARCFIALGSWSRVWTALQQYNCKKLSISTLSLCLQPLVSEPLTPAQTGWVTLAVHLVADLTEEDYEQDLELGSHCADLVASLWLLCFDLDKAGLLAQLGGHPNKKLPSTVRKIMPVKLRSHLIEWILGGDIKHLVSVLKSSWEVLNDLEEIFVRTLGLVTDSADTFTQLAEGIQASNTGMLTEDYNKFLLSVGIALMRNMVERCQWDAVVKIFTFLSSNSLISLVGENSTIHSDLLIMVLEGFVNSNQLTSACDILQNAEIALEGSPTSTIARHRVTIMSSLFKGLINSKDFEKAHLVFWNLISLYKNDIQHLNEVIDPQKLYNDFVVICCDANDEASLKVCFELVKKATSQGEHSTDHHQGVLLVLQAFSLRYLLTVACRNVDTSRGQLFDLLKRGQTAGIYSIEEYSNDYENPSYLRLPTDASTEEIQVLLMSYCRGLRQRLLNTTTSGKTDKILEMCSLLIVGIDVGLRDTRFVQLMNIDNTPAGLLQRAEAVLTKPLRLYCSIKFTKKLHELEVDKFGLYNCVYYSELD